MPTFSNGLRVLGLVVLSGLVLIGNGAQAQSSRTVADTVDLERDGEVEVNATAGAVRVTTWDRAAVEMTVRIEGKNAQQVEATRIQVEGDASHVTIKTKGKDAGDMGILPLLGFGGSSDVETHYSLRIPATASLSVTTQSASVHVSGLEGEVEVEGASSPVRLRDTAGEVMIATFSGSLDADSVQGEIMYATFSGDARVKVTDLAEDYQFASFSGDAELTLPADAAFDLRTNTSWGGSVTSDFAIPDSSAQSEEAIPIGGGGPTIAFESFSGSLILGAE